MKYRHRKLGNNAKSFIYALLVHVLVIIVVGVNFSWSTTRVRQPGEVIQARVITELPPAKEDRSPPTVKPTVIERKTDKKPKKTKKKIIKRPSREYLKRKAEQQRRKQDQADLQRRLALETKEREVAARQRRIEGAKNQYVPLIQQKVQNNWAKPPGWKKGVKCVVNVRLVPNGEVLSARVVQSCGNSIFDRSVVNAVYKASPLPVPTESDIFESTFRNFDLRFNPIG